MALVAYDNSDSSEYEDDENENTIVVTLNKKVDAVAEQKSPIPGKLPVNDAEEQGTSQTLFNLLPQPTNKKPAVVEEDDDEFLHKKAPPTNTAKPKARITVPSLSDFKDVEESIPNNKPRPASTKKSGLLSILPQPKNGVKSTTTSKSLIPHVLTQKPNVTAKKKEPLPSPMKKSKTEIKPLVNEYSDDSDDDEVQNDFFSINKPVDPIPEDDLPLDIDVKPEPKPVTNKQPVNIQSYFKQEVVENHVELQPDTQSESSSNNYYGLETNPSYSNNEGNSDAVLDDEALLKLVGARAKRKREDIQIVDVNQQEVLADAREWLLKGLMDDTSKRVSSSKKKGNEPTSQQKRKHQITYLAHQAKANEAELQNQWANNRQSKRQTQSKYGF